MVSHMPCALAVAERDRGDLSTLGGWLPFTSLARWAAVALLPKMYVLHTLRVFLCHAGGLSYENPGAARPFRRLRARAAGGMCHGRFL